MIAAKRQWLEEKEQRVEEEVALAKVHWEKEEKEVWNLGQCFFNFFCCCFVYFQKENLYVDRLMHCYSAICSVF